MPGAPPLARHQLAWLAPDWPAQSLAPPAPPALAAWFGAGRPAMVRRRAAGEPGTGIALGVALPPAQGGARLGLVVADAALRAREPPPLLAAALASAPRAWQAALRALDRGARKLGVEPRVYGSLAWQHLTGQPYVEADSDVDLLLAAPDAARARAMLALLVCWERDTGRRADGELLLPDGAAVAWRELLGAAPRVLVKSLDAVALRASASVWAALVGRAA
jgi:phosphoribosyl-dephospho-CoA transferase